MTKKDKKHKIDANDILKDLIAGERNIANEWKPDCRIIIGENDSPELEDANDILQNALKPCYTYSTTLIGEKKKKKKSLWKNILKTVIVKIKLKRKHKKKNQRNHIWKKI